MASPAAPDTETKPKGADYEQVPFQFCRECSNMLLPKEDRENGKLTYVCRTCAHVQDAVTPCVYRNQLHNTVGETAGVTQDVGADPTVGGHGAPCASAFPAAPRPRCEDLTCMLCGWEIRCYVCGAAAGDECDEVARLEEEMEDDEAVSLEESFTSESEGPQGEDGGEDKGH